MASVKGFLTSYFKQLHFNAMSPEVRARWDEYTNLPDLTNSMKDWKNQLMHEVTPNSGKFVNNDLPDISTGLTDDQITELYKQMNDVISGMAEDKTLKNAEYVAAKKFIEDFYGDTNIFHITKVSEPTNDDLKKLVTSDLLDKLKQPIEDAIRYVGGEKKPSFRDIVDGITSGKYDKDSTFRSQLIDIFERVESAASWTWAQRATNRQALDDFVALRDGLIKGLQPDPMLADIERFKRNLKRDDDQNVLIRLYKKAKAKELFAKHDSYGITRALDTARSEVDYDKTDSENYLYPKTEEHLNFPQTIKKKWDKFSENRLEKWRNLGGDYMFQSRAAEDIVKAIKKANIKPTDGLEAILNKSKDIKTNMAHTGIQTGKHFDWFIKEMNVIKEADGKAFEACLRNGISLRGVVQRICKDAAENGKIAEAKTALEILSVIKYENTTSKTLDAIKEDKELFNLLSNNDLSWNKNEGVKFVTGALDKTIRVAGIAVATMATVAVNSIRKLGSKIHKENKDLSASHNDWKKKIASQKSDLTTAITDSQTRVVQATNDRDAIIVAHGPKTTIDAEVTNTETNRNTILNDPAHVKNLQNIITFVENGMGTDTELNAAKSFLNNYKEYIDGTNPSLIIPTGLPPTINTLAQDVRQHLWQNLFKSADTKWRDAKKVQNDFVDAANRLISATDELTANQAEMTDWDKNHKDRYDELIQYWNKLEFGRDMHLGRLFGGHYSRLGSKKTQQALHYQMFNNGMTKAA
jgi:hypothetical protein